MNEQGAIIGGTIVFTIAMIVFSLVVTVVPLIFFFKWMSKMRGQTQALLMNGMPAQARVVQVGATGLTVNNSPQLNLVLEVHPQPTPSYRGVAAPFMATVQALVPIYAMARVQPGAMVPVKFNPQNPMDLVVDFRAMGFM